MQRDDIEKIISEKINQSELKNAESRLHFVLWFGGAFLAIFGVITPIYMTSSSTDRVDKSIESMERRFEELVGKQLRRPIIECLYQNTKLEGQLVDCSHQEHKAISGIVIQNKGDGIAWITDIYLYLKFEKSPNEFSMTWWDNLDHIDEPGFERAFKYAHTINNMHPQEPVSLKIGQWARVEKDQKVKALLKIYYGEPEPLRINWSINIK